ncbi:hypothetical protein H6F51_12525 [Cyanobacteria bacterium FACHB-DQ100]|uniref:hypothetical protein n=1 Tax=Leptolyngbya sp. DQ-M1 TaxID=2933920 RepID=UPI0019CCA126|nr:hypothetical protein [Cyanobacteria bacterium FACHB-DQ100]
MTVKRAIQIILAIVLAVGLTACGGRYSVPGAVLKKAIAITVDRTQQEISQQLKLTSAPKVTIDRVKITDQTPLKIEGFDGYHVKGEYDFTLKQSKRQDKQVDNIFDLYLQRQIEGKTQTWRLAQQSGDEWNLTAIDPTRKRG